MRAPIREQDDYSFNGDEISLAAGLACDPNEDKARQEFKEDTDVNAIVRRFGANAFADPRNQQYSVTDFNLDLQALLEARRSAEIAFQSLDPELRKGLPTFEQFMAALAVGDLALVGERVIVVADDGGEQPASAAATAQAEGAGASGESVT